MTAAMTMEKSHPAYMPKIIAHRGAAGTMPENTMSAFHHAADIGALAVEFDVTISRDGTAIVMHDYNVDRCSDSHGPVVLKTMTEINKIDAGGWFDPKFRGEHIPHLEEVLDFSLSRSIAVNLEIKPTLGWEEPTARAVANVVKKYWPFDQKMLVSSMSTLALDVFHDVMPQVPLGLIVCAPPENLSTRFKQHHCQSLHCSREFATPELVEQVRTLGFRLHVYTVNDIGQAAALFAMGVDSIFTDFPEYMLEKYLE